MMKNINKTERADIVPRNNNVPDALTIISGIALAALAYYVSRLMGYFTFSPIFGFIEGYLFAAIFARNGIKAFLLPVAGAIVGLIGIVFVQSISGSPTLFPTIYYIFIPALAACIVTFIGSLLLQIIFWFHKQSLEKNQNVESKKSP
jgi:peptidoglycan/LPS O-acetylase OafA/YrhL